MLVFDLVAPGVSTLCTMCTRQFVLTMCLLVVVAQPFSLKAQQDDTLDKFSQPITLDTFVVKQGFDIGAFIRKVQRDTSFYKSFRSMHLVPSHADNHITAYNKKNSIAAEMTSTTLQKVEAGCRHTEVLKERVMGNFYKKNGGYTYYTAELFDYLFFSKVPVCGENDIVAGALQAKGEGRVEKSKYELKQLIFNPGSKVDGIPMMGKKASVFDADEAEKYDFRISQEPYGDTLCFVFRITPKPGQERKVVYNELTTWFRKGDFSILARNYSLSYRTLVYDFDVRMQVRTTLIGGKIYPVSISYDGDWHILTQKRERVKFTVAITY